MLLLEADLFTQWQQGWLRVSIGKSFFKNIYKWHVYAGIFVAVHFVIFALSGLVLLFKHEIQGETATASSHSLNSTELAQNYERILSSIAEQYPSDRPLAFYPDDNNENQLNVRLGIDGATKLRGARRLSFDLTTAEPLPENPSRTSDFFDWTLRLHRELLLGPNGKLYVGFVGMAYVFMLLSGFFIYGKFMKGRSFGEIRKARIPSRVDLHKFTGVITFGWGLVVGLSGVFLAFNGVLIQLFQLRSLEHLSKQYQGFQASTQISTPFSQVISIALSAKSDTVISYISFPATEYGIPGHYLVLVNGTTNITKRLSDLVVVNAETGKLAEIVELPLYMKIVLLSEPLHFGDYGGRFLKVLWALFTLGSLMVVLLGVYSFFMKRKMRKQAVISNPESSTLTPKLKPEGLRKSVYALPTLISTAVIVGITAALFASGVFAQVSMSLLLLPIIFMISAWRKNG